MYGYDNETRKWKKVFVMVKTLHGHFNSNGFYAESVQTRLSMWYLKNGCVRQVQANNVMLTVTATPAAASLPLMSPLPYFHGGQMDLWKAVWLIIPPLSLKEILQQQQKAKYDLLCWKNIQLKKYLSKSSWVKIKTLMIYYGSFLESTDSGILLLFHGKITQKASA